MGLTIIFTCLECGANNETEIVSNDNLKFDFREGSYKSARTTECVIVECEQCGAVHDVELRGTIEILEGDAECGDC